MFILPYTFNTLEVIASLSTSDILSIFALIVSFSSLAVAVIKIKSAIQSANSAERSADSSERSESSAERTSELMAETLKANCLFRFSEMYASNEMLKALELLRIIRESISDDFCVKQYLEKKN